MFVDNKPLYSNCIVLIASTQVRMIMLIENQSAIFELLCNAQPIETCKIGPFTLEKLNAKLTAVNQISDNLMTETLPKTLAASNENH